LKVTGPIDNNTITFETNPYGGDWTICGPNGPSSEGAVNCGGIYDSYAVGGEWNNPSENDSLDQPFDTKSTSYSGNSIFPDSSALRDQGHFEDDSSKDLSWVQEINDINLGAKSSKAQVEFKLNDGNVDPVDVAILNSGSYKSSWDANKSTWAASDGQLKWVRIKKNQMLKLTVDASGETLSVYVMPATCTDHQSQGDYHWVDQNANEHTGKLNQCHGTVNVEVKVTPVLKTGMAHFDVNGGSGDVPDALETAVGDLVPNQVIDDNRDIQEITVAKDNYQFLGWFDSKSGTQWDFDNNRFPDVSDMTLVAQFAPAGNNVTMDVFSDWDYTHIAGPYTESIGQKINSEDVAKIMDIINTQYVPQGYTLTGWRINHNGNDYEDFDINNEAIPSYAVTCNDGTCNFQLWAELAGDSPFKPSKNK